MTEDFVGYMADATRDERTYYVTDRVTKKSRDGLSIDREAKSDEGKPRMSLVPPALIEAVGRVRTYGVEKYQDPDNWKRVEPWRYRDAFMRHMCAWLRDPASRDPESGLPHVEHMACNLAFLLEFKALEEQEC